MSEWQDNTGECPVGHGVLVDVKFRDGYVAYRVPAGHIGSDESYDDLGEMSHRCAWDWSIDDVEADIIQWRLHEEEPEYYEHFDND